MLALFLFFLSLDSANFELTISDNQVEIHAPYTGANSPQRYPIHHHGRHRARWEQD